MADLPDSARGMIDAVASAFADLPSADLPSSDVPGGGLSSTERPQDSEGAQGPAVDGPIGWAGYDAARERARQRTGEQESVVCGIGNVDGVDAVLIAFDFGFLGGSIG